jgi:hypothetical protein
MGCRITEINAFDLVGRHVSRTCEQNGHEFIAEYVVTHLTYDATKGRVLVWIHELATWLDVHDPACGHPVGQPQAVESLEGFRVGQHLDPAFRQDNEVDLVGHLITNQHGVEYVLTHLTLDAGTAQVLFWLDDIDLATGNRLDTESGVLTLDKFTVGPLLPATYLAVAR